MQLVVSSAWQSHDFQAAIGDDLIDVHVGRGTGTALKHIERELAKMPARRDFLTDLADDIGLLLVQIAERRVGARRCHFHIGKRLDEVWEMADPDT